MTFQFKDIAGDNTPARQSVTNRSTVLLAQRLGLLIALQFKNTVESPPARRRATTNRTLVLLALCLGVLVAQIDTSVVNLATHAIGATFQAGVAPLQWVLDAYNLVYAVLLLSGGPGEAAIGILPRFVAVAHTRGIRFVTIDQRGTLTAARP